MTLLLMSACGGAQTVESTDASTSDEVTVAAAAASGPADAPSDAATSASEPSVATSDATASVADLQTGLLTPEALPDPGPGFSWVTTRDRSAARPSVRLFDPCEPTDYPTDPQRTEVLVRDLRVEEPGGAAPETAEVRQNLARYGGPDVTADAIDGFLRAAQECDRSGPEGATKTTEVIVAEDDRLLLQTTPDIGLSTLYTIVERRGDVVTLVRYYPGETREADRRAQRIADAVTAALDTAG
ncbi:MAG TPA: hypothetical protein VK923_05350 [Euzebyales bacterium]|nr:hypothetical protein [Euzebyales bacterium]